MKVIVSAQETFALTAAQYFIRCVLKKPDCCVGLAGGNTTAPIYAAVVRLVNELEVDVSRVRFFNVDEYFHSPKTEPGTCLYRMRAQLLDPLGVPEKNIFCFSPDCRDPEEECARVCADLAEHGGIDLQYLGIGANGHIGFCQPGTPFGKDAFSFPFKPEFFAQKAAMFGGEDKVPRMGMTLGIKNCMQARQVLIAANDGSKTEIVRRAAYGPVTEEVPASALQLHPDAVLLASEAASSLL